MNADDYITHRFLMDTFWKEFEKKLDKRTTEEQYHSLFNFEIGIQERKLNRYRETLRPDLYTDDALVVSEQENLLVELKSLYEQFKSDDIGKIEPIRLAYDLKNEKVIEILHKILYPNFIKCTFDEFQIHFIEQDDYIPIQWYKSETCIADLFKEQVRILNDDWAMLIVSHFCNKNGKRYKHKQVISVGSNRISANYTDSETIKSISKKINTL